MRTGQEKDALIALISTLTVAFVVLFISLSYFVVLGNVSARREAAAMRELDRMRHETAQSPTHKGTVAGYETEQPASGNVEYTPEDDE